jgi:hypothetical protein
MKKIYVMALLSTVILINGCKKEGPAGPAGKDGNANVQSSTITFSTWNWDAVNKFEYSDFTWSAITPAIANTGTVLVYLSTSAGWTPLPRTIYPSTTYSESQRYTYKTGAFTIVVQDSDLTPPAALGTWTIKVLAIESRVMLNNSDVDWANYEKVKERFKLKD